MTWLDLFFIRLGLVRFVLVWFGLGKITSSTGMKDKLEGDAEETNCKVIMIMQVRNYLA